ncbi:MAG: AraC family transcriptional regulator [Cellulophaga sp.]
MSFKDGFKDEKAIVLPKEIIKEFQENEITKSLFITDIGYYSNAKNHYRERLKGIQQYILIYCIKGKGWIEIHKKRTILEKNDYVIISIGIPHKYGADNSDPWSIYWLHFTGEKAHLLVNHPNEKINIDSASNGRFNDRLLLFEEIFHNLAMGFSTENFEYANICLWHMLGSFRYLSQFRKINEINSYNKIDLSIKHMVSNISKKITLDELAEHCNLSISQYCSLFKKKTSRTPLNYFAHLKIRQASHLLDYSDLRISEIALKVGFDDPFYFSRLFSKIMGKSPRNYRNIKKG